MGGETEGGSEVVAAEAASARDTRRDAKESSMAKVSPYHTNSTDHQPEHRNVHHDHDKCPDGKRIRPQHRLNGTGNKPRCDECIRLG